MDELTGNGRGMRRRELLIAGAAGGATLALAGPVNYSAIARARKRPFAKDGTFPAGVMSGIPTPKGITLWTRLGEIEKSSRLNLEVSTDKNFKNIVRDKTAISLKRQNFTVRTRVGGLKPDTEYFYRFSTKESDSRVGTFRTAAPTGSNRPIKIGFLSCQSYEAGYYNAQAAMAKEDVDLVICLGDYMYETGFFGGPADRKDTTGNNNDGDVQELNEYREKYAFYQAEPNLQAMHAAHPFVAIWDDHEVEDNYAGDDPDPANGDPNTTKTNGAQAPRRVPYLQRRLNGYRAFFEHMPRLRVKEDLSRIFGQSALGNVDVFYLDERQYRDPQPCGGELLNPCAESKDPNRTLLGSFQKGYLKGALSKSQAKWKLLANQVTIMSLDLVAGSHVNPDQWDGYEAERAELGNYIVDNGIKNVVVATGDIHTFFTGTATTTGNNSGRPFAAEFVGGSCTSTGIPEALGVPPASLEAARATQNPHISYADFEKRGYGIITAGQNELTCEYKSVDALTKGAPAVSLAKFRLGDGETTPQRI